jgi:phage shock protein PspC (stress-responsive transcriptional regulator)
MKKVININFHGRVIPIEETAYDLLKQYTDSLRNYFANEEGRDEIINDIESRIAELFDERIKAGATCITDADINAIIINMGRPQDFADADEAGSTTTPKSAQQSRSEEYQQSAPFGPKKLYRDQNNKVLGGVCSGIAAYFNIEPIIVRLVFIFSGIGFFAYILLWIFVPGSDSVYNGVKKRLFRDPDNQLIAGVCSGIAAYFNINAWIPRVLFLLPSISFFFNARHFWNPFSLSFSPGSLIIYIILWLVLPEAKTTTEKLEMRGEKVDLNSIKNTVVEEMKEVKDRINKKGGEIKEYAQQKGSEIGAEVRHAARKTGSSIGNIILFIVKMFAYFIVGVVSLACIAALFAITYAALGIFPLKGYILSTGWQEVLAWGSLIFFIAVPVIGIITWIIRRIAKIRRGSNLMRYSFIALWIIGWFCIISLIASVARDFKSRNRINEESITLSNPLVNRIEVVPTANTKYYSNEMWFHFEPFANLDEDTIYINNVKLRIVKSPDTTYKVSVLRLSNGPTRAYADSLARAIIFNVQQVDSFLYVDKGIALTSKEQFRNQHVVLTIAIPVGKVINISRQFEEAFIHGIGDDWRDTQYEFEEVEGWSYYYGEDLVMKADGLYTLKGKQIKEEIRQRNSRTHGSTFNTDGDDEQPTIERDKAEKRADSIRMVKEREAKKITDSLEKVKEQIDKKIEKINESNTLNENTQQEHACTFMLSI